MNILFLGATGTVTGSKFLVESEGTHLLVDCGLFQGYKWLRERNWQPPPFELDALDGILLTHAHLDHSGFIPRLYQLGYRGPVYCHHATRELCGILLPDAGRIQEEDAHYYARHKISKHAHPEPLYGERAAEDCLQLFHTLDFNQSVQIGSMRAHLQPVGHILGAGSVILEGEGKRVGFSGDVGRAHDLFMFPPHPLPKLDLLLLESTYGNRLHPRADVWEELAEIVKDTVQRGGVLLIPSFAVGRAQTLQYMLTQLMREKRIPPLPTFLDSPMAIDVSELYCRYADQHRLSDADCRRMSEAVTTVRSVDESKALSSIRYPHIIIAGAGMLNGGRILHHMKRLLPNHRTTLLLTGYQAGGTRGAYLGAGADSVKIHGEDIPCKARIAHLDGLSGHADYRELTAWLKDSALEPGTPIQLVHGDEEALEAMRKYLQAHTRFKPAVAQYRHFLRL